MELIQNLINGIQSLVELEKALENKTNIDKMMNETTAYIKKKEYEIVQRVDPVNGFPDLSKHNNLLAEVKYLIYLDFISFSKLFRHFVSIPLSILFLQSPKVSSTSF